MDKRIALVTGASRGIGLEFVKQLAAKGWEVIATARDPRDSAELSALAAKGACRLQALDVTQESSVATLADLIKGLPRLDWVINNAGVMGPASPSSLAAEASDYAEVFTTNVLGPLAVTKACRAKLSESRGAVLASLSSLMGSIEDNESGGYGPYRVSKAALNMLNKNFSIELPKVTCVVLHPGWVRTRMGGESAPLEAPESVRGMLAVLERLTLKDSGKFFDHAGDTLPW